MSHAAVDFETYYDKQVSIKTLGGWHYLRHPQTDIYLCTVYDGHQTFTGRPEEFDWRSLDGRVLVSHNAAFDKMVADVLVERGLIEMPEYTEWNCTANLAVYVRAHRALKSAIRDLYNEPVSKDYRKFANAKTVEEMMQDPEGWADLVNSNVMDTQWSWHIWNDYSHLWPDMERRISVMTYEQAHRGIPINLPMVIAGIKVMTQKMHEAAEGVPWECDATQGVTSIKELQAYCRQQGVEPPKSTSEDSPECKEWEAKYSATLPWIGHMRQWRKCNIVLKRLQVMRDRVTPSGWMPYATKYFGAHTGRWSGGSQGGTGEVGFNTQNAGKEAVHGVDPRKCLVASKGRKLIICDAAQIEPRCLTWCSGDYAKLELIRGGMSVYEVHARATMGWTGGEMKHEDKKGYRLAKDRVLGLGYGCGWKKFQIYTQNSGLDLSAAESKFQVNDFRTKEKHVIKLWNRMHTEFVDSVNNPEVVKLADGREIPAHIVELPSGRELKYFYPKMDRRANVYAKANAKKKSQTPVVATPPNSVKKSEDDFSPGDYRMEYCATIELNGGFKFYYGGLLVENMIQATARDVFAEAMVRLEDHYGDHAKILFHAHDEVVMDCDKAVDPKEVEEIMSQPPSWMYDCPFGAEAIESDHYLK